VLLLHVLLLQRGVLLLLLPKMKRMMKNQRLQQQRQ
jgi:hypothetical protein